MVDLRGFYSDLLAREGQQPALGMVVEWWPDDVRAITAAFRSAVAACGLAARSVRVGRQVTNQATGNTLALAFPRLVNPDLLQQGYWLTPCAGSGYPRTMAEQAREAGSPRGNVFGLVLVWQSPPRKLLLGGTRSAHGWRIPR
jgi:hypothetical protein